jgi:predicted nucleic acid-binding protein
MHKFVSNTSPILYLTKIDLIEKIYFPITDFIIPKGVKEEILAGTENDSAKKWIQSPDNKIQIISSQVRSEITSWDLGKGETEVLSYLLNNSGTIGIIDDLTARHCAKIYHLCYWNSWFIIE